MIILYRNRQIKRCYVLRERSTLNRCEVVQDRAVVNPHCPQNQDKIEEKCELAPVKSPTVQYSNECLDTGLPLHIPLGKCRSDHCW